MPELDERFHGIDRLEPPDLWEAARTRAASPRPPAPGPGGGKKILVIAVAFVVSAVAIAFVVAAFRSGDPKRPVEPPRNVVNGDLWVKVGGGEVGTAIGRVNLDPSVDGRFMWTDAPNVFAGTTAAPELLGDDYTFSPDGGRVAFSHATAPAPGSGPANQPVELFVMNADGSGLRQLTHDDAYSAFPAWSPDGQTIAYASYRGQGYIPGCIGLSICPSNLYLIDASGGEPSPLVSTTASETSPTWSPDGTRIAFAETNDGQGSIVSVKRDGSGRVELSPGGAVSFPAWSPDGTQILFLRMQDGTNHIWTVRPDDSGHHDIVDTRTDTNFGRPVWSPDGTKIAFARPYAGATAVWTIDRYGDMTPERIAGWPGFDGAPIAWRPEPSRASSPPAEIAEVTCSDSGIDVRTPVVRASRDGLRVVIRTQGSGWTGLRVFRERIPLIGRVTEGTSSAAPGVVTVACVRGRGPDADESATASFELVDPDGFYQPWDLPCGFGEQTRVSVRAPESATPVEVLRSVPGVLPTDVLRHIRYPGSAHYSRLDRVLVRDDVAIARFILGHYDEGTWRMLLNGCPDTGIGADDPLTRAEVRSFTLGFLDARLTQADDQLQMYLSAEGLADWRGGELGPLTDQSFSRTEIAFVDGPLAPDGFYEVGVLLERTDGSRQEETLFIGPGRSATDAEVPLVVLGARPGLTGP